MVEASARDKGPYILEGGHRFDALKLLGKKSFPALVVIDTSEEKPSGEGWTSAATEHEETEQEKYEKYISKIETIEGKTKAEKLKAEAKTEEARRIKLAAAAVATKLGFDAENITVSHEDKTFTLNDKQYNYAGGAPVFSTKSIQLVVQNHLPRANH